MSRDPRLYLEDIITSGQKVVGYTRGMSFEAFAQDERTFDAVVRNLEIIGEATKHLPESLRAEYSEIPWRKIAGLRDAVAHAYFGVDEEIIWDVVENHIGELVRQVEVILESWQG